MRRFVWIVCLMLSCKSQPDAPATSRAPGPTIDYPYGAAFNGDTQPRIRIRFHTEKPLASVTLAFYYVTRSASGGGQQVGPIRKVWSAGATPFRADVEYELKQSFDPPLDWIAHAYVEEATFDDGTVWHHAPGGERFITPG